MVIVVFAGLRRYGVVGRSMIMISMLVCRNGRAMLIMMINYEAMTCCVVPHLGLRGRGSQDQSARDQSGDDAPPNLEHALNCSHALVRRR